MELHFFSWNFSLTLRHEPYVKGEAVATQPAPFWVWYEDRWQITHWGKSCDITMSLSTYCISTTLHCPCKLGSSGLWFLICERQTVLRRALWPRLQCRKRETVWNLHASIVIIVLFPLSYKKRCGFPEFSFFEKRKVEAYSTSLFKFIFKCMGWTQQSPQLCLLDLSSPETFIGLCNPKHNLSHLRSEIAVSFPTRTKMTSSLAEFFQDGFP